MTKTKTTGFQLPGWLSSKGWSVSDKAPTLRGKVAIDAARAGSRIFLKHDQFGWMVADASSVGGAGTLEWIERTVEYQAKHPHGYALINALQHVGA